MNPSGAVDVRLFRVACLLGLIGVMAGAFGAHALQDHVTAERLDTFRTGVRYLLFHVPVVLLFSALPQLPRLRVAAWVLVAGMTVFTGTLFALVLFDQAWLGAITPVGGVGLIVGWGLALIAPRSA